jgi:hypothetical protein
MFFRGSLTVTRDWSRAGNAVKIVLYRSIGSHQSGAIAQLGERVVRNDEAVGSIPTSSTKSLNNLPTYTADFGHRISNFIGP